MFSDINLGDRTSFSRLDFSWLIKGKLAGHAAPGTAGDLEWLKAQGIRAIVRLTVDDGSQIKSKLVVKAGFEYCHEPVKDFCAPGEDQIDQVVAFIGSCLKAEKPVGVCCFAGYGRTGTLLACYMV